jgi:predicted RNA binding protein YcfA (HicA-like mRNA interferase family)
MPKKWKTVSGKLMIKMLMKQYGFSIVAQRGSHIKLRKTVLHKTITTIVPNHKELARGTISGILDLAHIDEKDFLSKL